MAAILSFMKTDLSLYGVGGKWGLRLVGEGSRTALWLTDWMIQGSFEASRS